MKKLFFLMAFACLIFSCDNDNDSPEPELTFEERLAGDWALSQVDYTFELPAGLVGPAAIEIEGTATNVEGDFEITQDPNTISWNYQFDVDVTGVGAMNLSDIREGTWTWDEESQTISFTFSDDTRTTMQVVSETENQVVLQTKVLIEIPMAASFEVDTVLTLTKG